VADALCHQSGSVAQSAAAASRPGPAPTAALRHAAAMWVLTPILRTATASQRPSASEPGAATAAAAAATPNVNHFLVAGPIKVGRAGSGGLDIEVRGDGSVSARHATLLLQDDGTGGSLVVLIGGPALPARACRAAPTAAGSPALQTEAVAHLADA
jgi:hypothetical protein